MWRAMAVAVMLLAVPAHLYAQPCVEVTKEVDCDISMVGYEVIYTICVTNCSDPPDPLQDLTVVDDVMGDISSHFPSAMAAGEVACAEIAYMVQSYDPDPLANTVEVHAIGAGGGACSDEAVEVVDLVHPGFVVEVQCLSFSTPPGADAEFEVVLTNVGDVPVIIQTDAPELPSPFELAVGESFAGSLYETCVDDVVCATVNADAFIPPEYCELDAVLYASDTACCECAGGTPAETQTWGVIKALYRK